MSALAHSTDLDHRGGCDDAVIRSHFGSPERLYQADLFSMAERLEGQLEG